ncbi:UDP-GlcNAc--UDP-phosphate GlcNAc-1-phosphate transferase [Sphingobacterium mizutaii]|uniref:UDP-GlcNAc--UDP-phosphate GlcNAc-1-phosphate transferase n=1 Tax=Sphingobacterium mizutaii TaxID=1010 RepID=UPI0028AF983E|nr:UDP-GlcNAc--UDP-phosphate GlcNAc-1-phosphate transferase [Sphingobacterium mizutaii]
MFYLTSFVLLLFLELFYFRIAEKFGIIDIPNNRSSHSIITLRGGGVIFYFSVMLYFIHSGGNYPWFFVGLTSMAVISFLDDIFSLPNKIRLLVHFASVSCLAYELGLFTFPWFILVIAFVFSVGVINAFNFMDGINGITVCYSLSIIGLLLIVNNKSLFVPMNLMILILISLIIFAFFNFRPIAKTFAGDVGSVSIAFIIVFFLGLLIVKTNNLIYLLFLVVYGIDTGWTIIFRLLAKENIFKPHRSHIYQLLGNEGGINKLFISFLYGFLQFIIGLIVIYLAGLSNGIQVLFGLFVIIILSFIYLFLRRYLINKYFIETK